MTIRRLFQRLRARLGTRYGALLVIATLSVPALGMSAPASATEVTFTAKLNNYYGNDAYLAMYLTDRNGQYQRTLWVAGRHAKYYRHLRQWARAGGQSRTEYDGRTGASVQSGHILKVTADLPDSLIDAGYDVRIDSAVEDFRDSPSDVVTPLTRDGAGQPVAGRGFVDSFRYDFR